MKKKLLAVLLALVLTVGNFAGVQIAYAEESGDFFGITWSFDGVDTLILDGNGPMFDFEPSGYYDIPWAVYAPDIKHVVINSGLTTVKGYIYEDCTQVIDVTIPDTVEVLSYASFPTDSTKFEKIIISEDNKNYASVDGVAYSKNKTTLIRVPTAYTGEFIIPDTVKTISSLAFYKCVNLSGVSIPQSVEEIGVSAFVRCTSLAEVTIPDSVKTIGDRAFSGCIALTDISIGKGVSAIGVYAFEETSYYKNSSNWDTNENGRILYIDGCLVSASVGGTELKVKDGTRLIADKVFFDDNFTSVELPDTVIYIGNGSFSYCYFVESIKFSNNLAYIGEQAFASCEALKEITLPDSLVNVGKEAFWGCCLTSLHIPKNVENIGAGAFSANYYSEITVDENNESFVAKDGILFSKDMTRLVIYPFLIADEKYSIPNTVTHIAPYAFNSCENLKEIIIPDTIVYIGDESFSDCRGLTKIEIPENVEYIGMGAFVRCRLLESVKLPSKLTCISEGMFSGCVSLKEIDIPDTVTEIGYSAFSGSALEKINIPQGITVLKYAVLNGCAKLTDVTIPNSVVRIERYAFGGCTNLKEITIPDSVKYIGEYTFWNCDNIKTIDIPDSVKYIGSSVFSSCDSLESVVFPATLTYIVDGAHIFSNVGVILYTGTQKQFEQIDYIEEVDFSNKQVVYNYDRGTYVKARGSYTYNSGSGFTVPLYYALKDCVALMGIYDEETLICLGVADVKKDDKEVTIKLNGPYTGYTFKWMFWEDLNSMNEMGNPVEINTTIQGPAKQ